MNNTETTTRKPFKETLMFQSILKLSNGKTEMPEHAFQRIMGYFVTGVKPIPRARFVEDRNGWKFWQCFDASDEEEILVEVIKYLKPVHRLNPVVIVDYLSYLIRNMRIPGLIVFCEKYRDQIMEVDEALFSNNDALRRMYDQVVFAQIAGLPYKNACNENLRTILNTLTDTDIARKFMRDCDNADIFLRTNSAYFRKILNEADQSMKNFLLMVLVSSGHGALMNYAIDNGAFLDTAEITHPSFQLHYQRLVEIVAADAIRIREENYEILVCRLMESNCDISNFKRSLNVLNSVYPLTDMDKQRVISFERTRSTSFYIGNLSYKRNWFLNYYGINDDEVVVRTLDDEAYWEERRARERPGTIRRI